MGQRGNAGAAPAVTIVFYVSGHGFGHASRDVEVINTLGAARPDVRWIIRSAVSPVLLERTLKVPYELRPGPCDTGVIQSTSLAHDDEATIREAIAFCSTLDDRAGREADALAHDDVRLVVGDIPPLAFDVAARLGVPSVALGNFTWDWIYEAHSGMADAAPWLVPRLRESYARATMALELPFGAGFEVFRDVRRIPLIARHAAHSRAETRRRFDLPADRPLALLSFGGYGLPDPRREGGRGQALDLSRLDCLDEWSIVTTDPLHGTAAAHVPREVHQISLHDYFASGFQYPDLVGAVDVVVTKPGYGIAAECIANGTSMLYTSRGTFREYDVLVREMPRFLRCRFIDQEDLFAGRWRDSLDALLHQSSPAEKVATNGAEIAAGLIDRLARQ